jgi:hypothetical protein
MKSDFGIKILGPFFENSTQACYRPEQTLGDPEG